MALEMPFNAPTGVHSRECYLYVKSLSTVDKETKFQLFHYYSRYNKENGDLPIYTQELAFIVDDTEKAPSYRKQAYEYVKSQPQFENAKDVLEEGQVA
jgi:hypothetical protein